MDAIMSMRAIEQTRLERERAVNGAGRKGAAWMPLTLDELTGPKEGWPQPSERQLVAIRRLHGGRGGDGDEDALNGLTRECREAGCPITEPGRSGRDPLDCPGWCELSARYARDRAAREAAAGKDPGTAKPYRLGPAARRACAAPEAGAVGAADLLELEKVASACRLGGCAAAGEAAECGADACPGWCAGLESAWRGWWSS